jgi:catechol 2,3-dioxygenase-like lactoylglutathione lyase family enzyme
MYFTANGKLCRIGLTEFTSCSCFHSGARESQPYCYLLIKAATDTNFQKRGGRTILHHIEINVSDLKKSIRFWEVFLSELGYQVFQRWEKGISWKAGTTYLVFVQTEERYLQGKYHRSQVGLNHLAFHAQSKEQVDDMLKKLKDLDIAILYDDRYPYAGGPSHYALFCEDPDRIKVELVAPVS